MTADTRTPAEIERDIEAKRSRLTDNIEQLQDKFSVDTLIRQVSDQFRDHGGDMTHAISEQVKANPIPLALTGIGLAWLMMGNTSRQTPAIRERHDDVSSVDRDIVTPAHSQRNTPVYSRPTPAMKPFLATPEWADHDDLYRSHSELSRDHDDKSVADKAEDALDTAKSKLGTATKDAKSTLSDAASAAEDRLSEARKRLAHGTEDLSEAARERVVAARKRAVEARREAMHALNRGTDKAADLYEEQPLIFGALALAVGAALGGALPSTQTENELMGQRSDELMEEAERLYREEKSKVMGAADAAMSEVKDIASEVKSEVESRAPNAETVANRAEDKLREAGERVADAAETGADRNNKPGTTSTT